VALISQLAADSNAVHICTLPTIIARGSRSSRASGFDLFLLLRLPNSREPSWIQRLLDDTGDFDDPELDSGDKTDETSHTIERNPAWAQGKYAYNFLLELYMSRSHRIVKQPRDVDALRSQCRVATFVTALRNSWS